MLLLFELYTSDRFIQILHNILPIIIYNISTCNNLLNRILNTLSQFRNKYVYDCFDKPKIENIFVNIKKQFLRKRLLITNRTIELFCRHNLRYILMATEWNEDVMTCIQEEEMKINTELSSIHLFGYPKKCIQKDGLKRLKLPFDMVYYISQFLKAEDADAYWKANSKCK